jgi:ParB-like chromosome segregation protein Spo0J
MDVRTGEGTWVELDEIAEGPGPCTMSYGFSLETLCESIRKVGVISAPLVSRNEKGGFDIVSGYRRILALKALGEPKAICKDVTSVLPSGLERLLANFYENLATRRFNEIEKAMILDRLRRHLKTEEILTCFMPLLSLPSHEDTFEFYFELLNAEQEVQLAVAREELSVRGVKALFELDKESQRVLFQWISGLRLNFNQQMNIIEYINYISKREDMSISQVLSEEPFSKLMKNARLNNPQKAKKMLEILRFRRYPRLTRAQQVIESTLSTISLPPRVHIRYDPHLEDPNYHLEVEFKNGKELRKTVKDLHALDQLEAILDPWASQ